MTEVTCPTACVEFSHPGMEHDEWLGGIRILATIRAYEEQEEDHKAELDDLAARLARVKALADEWERKADNAIAHDQMRRAGRLTHAARRLRAALAAAPSREGDQ